MTLQEKIWRRFLEGARSRRPSPPAPSQSRLATGGYAIAHSSPTASANAPAVGKVVPLTRGQPTPATPVGQVPPNFQPGTGTLITGTAADKAKAPALAAYPGGTVDRVVLLSNGEYNVHMIGVNWPHHVFVNQDFQVVGAL